MTPTMSDRKEDEVDWSDGSIDDPPDASIPPSGDSVYSSLPALRDPLYAYIPPSGDSGYSSTPPHRELGLNRLDNPQDSDDYIVPNGTPLSPGMYQYPTKYAS